MLHRLLALSALFFLVSCAPAHHYGFNPEGSNTDWSGKTPESAVVLVGFQADTYVTGMNEDAIASYAFPPGVPNVAAFHRKVGESYQLADIGFENAGVRYSLKFSQLPTIHITRPGIYYYGFVNTREQKAAFGAEPIEGVVRIARKRYAYLFEQFDPVNF